jgi:hypothetical protein
LRIVPGPGATALIARTRVIAHKSGLRLVTPMLVPSFSSKGFGLRELRKRKGKGKRQLVSELAPVLDFIAPSLTGSVLFSAYDVYYKLLPNALDHLEKADVVFIDSGGYEVSEHYDESQIYRPPYRHRKWSRERLDRVIGRLPAHLHLVIISYDSRGNLKRQVASASQMFRRYPGHVHDFLIKPGSRNRPEVNVDEIADQASALAEFDIVGVTEKELGNSLLNRLHNVSRIRVALDAANVEAPIHVFGSLDPLTVPLYFAAGAEILDGLSWLRFYYHDGLALYLDYAAVLSRGVQARWDNVRGYVLGENLACLQRLELDLRTFAHSKDFASFGPRAEVLEKAFQALATRLHGGA